jgi:hypothetical protein
MIMPAPCFCNVPVCECPGKIINVVSIDDDPGARIGDVEQDVPVGGELVAKLIKQSLQLRTPEGCSCFTTCSIGKRYA